jgi:D-alanine-D-alanine ligase-like ATP-grasp enzyme
VLDDPWRDSAIPIRFHDENGSVATILEAAKRNVIDGVLAVGDRPTVIAARVNEGLGFPGHPSQAAAAARNKRLTRERFSEAGLPVPRFTPASLQSDPRVLANAVAFPSVLKPLALSGSRGVMRVNDGTELIGAFDRLRALLQAPDIRAERNELHDLVLVEGFIPGREFALEGVMNHGTLHTLALFDKPDALDGPFFEETIYLAPSTATEETERAITDTIERAAHALGLRHGPIHAECRVSPPENSEPAKVFVLEVAARPIGGLCARALRFRTGGQGRRAPISVSGSDPRRSRSDPGDTLISLEELLLRHTLGESSEGWDREPAASGVMMIPIPRRGVFRGVSGIDDARAVPGVDDVRITAKPDQVLVPLPEGASYLGFIFARGQAPTEVDRALRMAHARLDFAIHPEVRVLQSLHG